MVTDASKFVDFVFIRCGPRKRSDLLWKPLFHHKW